MAYKVRKINDIAKHKHKNPGTCTDKLRVVNKTKTTHGTERLHVIKKNKHNPNSQDGES